LRKAEREQRREVAFINPSQEDVLAGAAGQAAGDVCLFADRPVPLIYGNLAKHLKAHQVREPM